ncbi:hypothetical protein JB92DRAFT_2829150 [Gautieria morchelliformis]|nr:hypothetical protein JB92DRAFT_2829150 [Gautieria morchelliformis]
MFLSNIRPDYADHHPDDLISLIRPDLETSIFLTQMADSEEMSLSLACSNLILRGFLEEELLYILRKLLELRLCSFLWRFIVPRLPIYATLLLCEITALPTKPPSAWVLPSMSNIDETVTVQKQPAESTESQTDQEATETRHSSVGVILRSKMEVIEVDSRQLSWDCLIDRGGARKSGLK